MEENSERPIPLAEYCAEKGLDLDEFRSEREPFHCIYKIGRVEFYSQQAYEDAVQEEIERRRYAALQAERDARVSSMVGTRKRTVANDAKHMRVIKKLPRIIAEAKAEIAKEEAAFANATALGDRFVIKQKLVELRRTLAHQETTYAESLAVIQKFVDDDHPKESEA